MKIHMMIGENGKNKENGTKADTLCLLHFDSNLIDSTGLSTWEGMGSYSFSDGKFGKSISLNSSDVRTVSQYIQPRGLEWTIEWWDKKIGNTGGYILEIESNPDICLEVNLSGDNILFRINNSFIFTEVSMYKISEVWTHRAIVSHAGKLTSYVDGIAYTSAKHSGVLSTFERTKIGCYGWPTPGFLIDEFRISNVARWTSNFTPPTKPY